MGENKELLNIQIQYKLIEELKIANQKLQNKIDKEISLKKEIEKINSELEKKVSEETQKNLDLSNSLYEHEIMASIGEVSSGIAHDLNTPLGAIKTSAESIRYTLQEFFSNDLGKVTPEEFDYAYKRVRKSNVISVFLSSKSQRKISTDFKVLLEKRYPNLKNTTSLSNLFTNARVGIEETETIDKVINAYNPVSFLNLMSQFQKVHSFIETILNSSEKAGKVIKNLSEVIQNKSSDIKEVIDLKENISTLIHIFKHELKNDIELNFNIEDDLRIFGYESQLFQLWSNLLKNAIFAVNLNSNKKTINIYSFSSKNTIDIVFENNGPKINEKEQDLIFKKFYTTKKKEGTGLGLGIVKNVVDSHQADISLKSNNERTSFTISFKNENMLDKTTDSIFGFYKN